MTRERLLVNFFYSHAVGHAVEALHYCRGHHAVDPERAVSVALNAASAPELAAYCPFEGAATVLARLTKFVAVGTLVTRGLPRKVELERDADEPCGG